MYYCFVRENNVSKKYRESFQKTQITIIKAYPNESYCQDLKAPTEGQSEKT